MFHLNGGGGVSWRSWNGNKSPLTGLNTRIKIIYKLETIKYYHDVQLMQVSENNAIW